MGKRKLLNMGVIAGFLVTTLVFMGGCIPTGTGEEGDFTTSIWPLLIFLVAIFGMMYFVMIRPQRKRQQEHQQLVGELRKGDKVITAGGIYGQIESVSDENVVLKIESGATIRVAKSSVVGKQGQEETRIG